MKSCKENSIIAEIAVSPAENTEVKEEMKKIICMSILILCMGLLSGCFKKADADTSTVFVEKKGKIISVDVEHLDKDYYDVDELEEYIKEHIEKYTSENGDTVEQTSFGVKDGIAKLTMEYDSCEDYAKFNGVELYCGTVAQAQEEGYDFDTEFYRVEDSSKQETVKKEDVLAEDENKIVIIKANVDVNVPGTVLYVSAPDTDIMSKNVVSIVGEGPNEEAQLTYIIYK